MKMVARRECVVYSSSFSFFFCKFDLLVELSDGQPQTEIVRSLENTNSPFFCLCRQALTALPQGPTRHTLDYTQHVKRRYCIYVT